MLFDSFSPNFSKRSSRSRRTSLFNLLKIDGIDPSHRSLTKIANDQIDSFDLWKRLTVIESIPLIFEKDRLWSNRSHRSLKKIGREWIDSVDLYKRSKSKEQRVTGAIRSFGIKRGETVDLQYTKDRRERFDLFHDRFDRKTNDQIPKDPDSG